MAAPNVDFDDIQALLRYGHRRHTHAVFVLLRVRDAAAARAWLARAPVANALPGATPPPTLLQVALSHRGLLELGVPQDVAHGFSPEFVSGMAGHASRSRRLGDVGDNEPTRWWWGLGERAPHLVVLLYALPGALGDARRALEADLAAGFTTLATLETSPLRETEPFGFVDGISQPSPDWKRGRAVRDQTREDYTNLACLGEFVLGYPNEYGGYTDRPLLDPARDGAASLPRAEDAPDRADLGRNGSYLVLRQLEQDVRGFWQHLHGQAGGDAAQRVRIAEAMVGRTLAGAPLVAAAGEAIEGIDRADAARNAFTYRGDSDGLRCPVGAHVRRANPRNADLPPGRPGFWSWLERTLGFDAAALRQDLVASTRFHRLLRRGRVYGTELAHDQALAGADARGDERGLHFVALNASIGRQFEFVQGAWIAGTRFAGLAGESDPLLGSRVAGPDGRASDLFTMPQAFGPDRRLQGLPRFVTVRGGAYFFLPGLRALRWIAGARREDHAMDSNTSRPVPPADTGSALLNWFAYTSLRALQLERRIDPWIRPAFDAVLRDPLTSLATALINLQRPRDDLKIAEERTFPDEEVWVDSIIESFRQQMQRLWKPGGFERGGNTKTQGIVRAELIVHDGLPEPLRRGVFAAPRAWPAWVRFSGPGPYVTPDIDDVGFMSISIKLMGVPGPKLMDEEQFTQDFFGVSTPTFVTCDVRSNAHLQKWSLQNAQIFHFLNLRQPHVLDGIMQNLWIKTQSSPLEAPYFSCVPYLHGEGQAMQYSVWPKTRQRTPIPNLPRRPPDDYLRNAMIAALDRGDVELDFRIQLQTDPWRMPIENNGVLWPEKLSPRVSVATLRIPRQTFASPAQIAFARRLSYNPWHCIAEHRPLGNQSRARKRMYYELSKLRHAMNAVPHYEPDGGETFE